MAGLQAVLETTFVLSLTLVALTTAASSPSNTMMRLTQLRANNPFNGI